MQAVTLYHITRKYSLSRTQILYLSSSTAIFWNVLLTCPGRVFPILHLLFRLWVWLWRWIANGYCITWSRWGWKSFHQASGFFQRRWNEGRWISCYLLCLHLQHPISAPSREWRLSKARCLYDITYPSGRKGGINANTCSSGVLRSWETAQKPLGRQVVCSRPTQNQAGYFLKGFFLFLFLHILARIKIKPCKTPESRGRTGNPVQRDCTDQYHHSID